LDIQDNGEITISLHSVQTLKDKKDEAVSHYEYTSMGLFGTSQLSPFSITTTNFNLFKLN
jgi:hypothetical protein